MDAPAWLVDEMLGRLARYLRFVGCDAEYVRGASDDEIVVRAQREHRVLLTRDRALSRRTPNSLLIESPAIAEQWRAVRAAWPSVPTEVRMIRCTLCNSPLVPWRGETAPPEAAVPSEVLRRRGPLYACPTCGHVYWEGSHTARIRDQIAAWERRPPP